MTMLAKVGSFNIDTSVTVGNTQAVTGVGFQPKIVLFWWSGSTGTGDGVAGGNIQPGFGAAISSTSRYCVSGFSLDAGGSSDTSSEQDNDTVITLYSAAGVMDGDMDFVSMDADGFTLIVDDQFTIAGRISYLALGGDDLTNVYLGSKQTPAVTGNYDVTGVGFQPDAIITFGRTTSTANGSGATLLSFIGMATGSSNQGVVSLYSLDAATTSNTKAYGYNGECYYDGYVNGTRGSFVSFGEDGFTLNELEASSQRYFYFAALKGGQYSVGELTTRTDGNDIAETVGFQPSAILFMSANRAVSTQDTMSDHARWSIGAGTSTSNRAAQAISDEDNLADSETAYANYDSAVYAHVADDAIVALMDIKSIESDGFTCVMDDTEAAGCWVTYLAIGSSGPSSSPSASISKSPSKSASASPSSTPSPSASPSKSPSASASASISKSPSKSASASVSASPSKSASASASASPSKSASASISASPSKSASASESASASASPSPSASASASISKSPSASTSASPSKSASASASASPSKSASASASASPSKSISASPSKSESASASASPSKSASASTSASPSKSTSASPSKSTSASISASPSKSASASTSASPSKSESASTSASPSSSASASPSKSVSASPSKSASASLSPSSSISASPSKSESASASASPSKSTSASPSKSASSSKSASPSASEGFIISGTVCWGHVTGVIEDNTRTYADNWTGTGAISNVGDAEVICLDAGEYMESEVVNTGLRTVELVQNIYNIGDDVLIKYRHGNSAANCLLAAWNNYVAPFVSLGYVQVRIESTL